jgi:hypothetical protein
MPTSTIEFGTTTAVTITLANIASGLTTISHSTLIDLSAITDANPIDIAVRLKFKVGATGTANTQGELWAYGGYANTNLPHNDADAAISATAATGVAMSAAKKMQMKLLVIQGIGSDGASATYDLTVGGVAQAFGGVLPMWVGFAFCHNFGAALTNVGGDHALEYTPIKYASA